MPSPSPVLERPSKPQTEESLALRLSDSQLDAVMRLCRPLAPPCRDCCCASSHTNYGAAAMSGMASYIGLRTPSSRTITFSICRS